MKQVRIHAASKAKWPIQYPEITAVWRYEEMYDSNETHHVQAQANLQAADDISSRMNSSLVHA